MAPRAVLHKYLLTAFLTSRGLRSGYSGLLIRILAGEQSISANPYAHGDQDYGRDNVTGWPALFHFTSFPARAAKQSDK